MHATCVATLAKPIASFETGPAVFELPLRLQDQFNPIPNKTIAMNKIMVRTDFMKNNPPLKLT
jgi:hypothetical protein